MEYFRKLPVLVFLLIFGDLAFGQNTMSIPNVSGNANDTITVSLHIDNSDEFVAFQTDIQLPTQVTYIDNSATLTDRANGHNLSASLVSGNTLRLIAYSNPLSAFSDNSGSVLDFEIVLSTNPGAFSLVLVDPIISDENSQDILTGSTNGTVTIYTPDINLSAVSLDFGETPLLSQTDRSITITNQGNVTLNISDIYTDNSYFEVLGGTSYSIPASGNQAITIRFNSVAKGTYAATLNIMSDDPDEAQSQVSLDAIAFAVNELHLQSASGRSGYPVDVTLSINNMEPFVGFQFDIILPSVLTFMTDSVKLTDRKSDHVVSANMVSGNQLRIVAYSPTNDTISGSSGDIVDLGFMLDGTGGNYSINLQDVIISDSVAENIVSAYYSGSVNIQSPDISAIQNVNYGEVSVLDTAEVSYTINNVGNDTLQINSFSSVYSYFWHDSLLLQIIPPGSDKSFVLKFNNLAKGNYTDRFTIRSNDPDEDPFYLDVSATAFAPNYIIVRDTMTFENNTATLKIDVENYEEFVAFQVDLQVPDSLQYIPGSARLSANRKQDHTISAAEINSNEIRVFSFSMSQLPFVGNSGTVAELDFNVGSGMGTFPLTLSNGILSNANSQNILHSMQNGQLQIQEGLSTFDMSVNSNWNMIGLPLEVFNGHYLNLFPNAIPNTLYGFNGTYVPYDTLRIGKGYWLRFPAGEAANIEGYPVNSNDLVLNQGWNMISGISCDVALNDVGDPGNIIIPSTLYAFEQTYVPSDTIKQGEGYWIRVNANGTITLDCGGGSSAEPFPAPLNTLTKPTRLSSIRATS